MKLLMMAALLSVSSFANTWNCTVEIVGKTQELDNGFTFCQEGGDWACYWEMAEECVNKSTGEKKITEFERFRFCTKNLSDCF